VPDGRIEKLKLGNGLWEAAKFNTRLQVTEFALGHGPESGNLWKLQKEYGELQSNGTVDASKNTGNIARQTLSFDGLPQPFVTGYEYDSLYRLVNAKETKNGTRTWEQGFTYDRYGNRLSHDKFIGASQIAQTNLTHPTIDPNTNRFTAGQGYAFDKNGNLVTDPADSGRSFVFNGDNKQAEVRGPSNELIGEYFYDGEGKRVKKHRYVGGVLAEVTVFVYSTGKLAAEYSTAPPEQNPTTKWTVTDQLGSPRVLVDSLGQVVSRRDFMPFGEEITPDGTHRKADLKYNFGDNIRQKFTGYQKDEETQLDFAEARMYQNLHGRFTAVDLLLASGKSGNPQTFNRYVYVMNNPLIYTDPSGLQVASRVGSWFRSDTPEPGRIYMHPKFLRPHERVPDGYRPMTPDEHVYFNNQRADRGERAAWTVSNPYRMDLEHFETRNEAVNRLYEFAPEFNPNRPANADSVGYINVFVGYSFPQAAGFGPSVGVIYDRETRSIMPQAGLIWSLAPGPVYNGTYSPLGVSDGFYATAGFGFGRGRLAASAGLNQYWEPTVEMGGSSAGVVSGVFFVYRPQREFGMDNSNSSEQSIESNRKRLGFSRPVTGCFHIRCNSSSNTNSNTNVVP